MSRLTAVRLAPADAIRVVGPQDARPQLLAVSEHAAAGVWYQVSPTPGLRVEPVSQDMGTSIIRIYSLAGTPSNR